MSVQWRDGKAGYGLLSIALHWIGAVVMVAMLIIGNSIHSAAHISQGMLRLHTSLGLSFYPLLLLRIFWRFREGHPAAPKQRRIYFVAGVILHHALLAALAVMLVSGPIMALTGGYGIAVFDWFTITLPWGQSPAVSNAMHVLHIIAASVIGYGTLLHLCGVFKHVIFDRDGTLDRMLAPTSDKA